MKFKKSNHNNYYTQLPKVLLVTFLILSLMAANSPYFGFDLGLSRFIQNIDSPFFKSSMHLVSQIGDSFILEVVIGLAIASLAYIGLKVESFLTFIFSLGSAITGSLIKNVVNRDRPESDLISIYHSLTDKSFPSLHVLVYTAFFGYMLYLALSKVKTPWLRMFISLGSALMIFSIGLSRIYLGVHWASDTLGGYLLGSLFLIANIKLSRKLTNQYAQR